MTVEWVEFVLYGYLAVTLLTAGATLSQGVRLMLVLAGAMLALFGFGPIQNLTNPMNVITLGPRVVQVFFTFTLMLIPAWCVLDGRHRPRLSVADGFLIGFLPGFGADCLQALTQPMPLELTWLIPGGQAIGGYWAGYGWWCGATTLAWSAAYRFGKDEHLAQLFASLVFGWAMVDRLGLIKFQGRGLVWATVIALLYYGLHERYWVRRSVGYRNLMSTPELEVPTVADTLAQLGPLGLAVRWRALARRRQILIERQELVDMGRVTIAEVPKAFKVDVGGADATFWLLRIVSAGTLVYSLTGPLPELAIASLIVLTYLIAPDLEPDDADPAVRVTVEQIVLNAALCAVILWMFLRPTSFPLQSPAIMPQKWETLLAFAFFAASWTGSQQRGAQAFWRPRHRRLAMLHRALTALKCGLVAYVLVNYLPKLLPKKNDLWLELLVALAAGALAALAAHLLNQLSDHVSEKFQQQG